MKKLKANKQPASAPAIWAEYAKALHYSMLCLAAVLPYWPACKAWLHAVAVWLPW